MAHALELAYAWRPPVLFATVGAFVCGGAVARSDASGRAGVVAVVVVLWLVFLVVVWARTRASLTVDGDRLVVRHVRDYHTVHADELVAVRQRLTAHGPSYRLVVQGSDGRTRGYVAPVALLRGGHSTLFGWILARASQAELDRGSQRTLDQLRVKGLVP